MRVGGLHGGDQTPSGPLPGLDAGGVPEEAPEGAEGKEAEMKIEELIRRLEREDPGLEVLIPTGMNFRPAVRVEASFAAEDERYGYWTPRTSKTRNSRRVVLLRAWEE